MALTYTAVPLSDSYADGLSSSRISGSDRVETSIKIAEKFNKAESVILATGDNYADALVASPLAYELKSPILLNRGKSLDKRVLKEIKDLQAKNVIIVGGNNSVSESIESTLKNSGLEVSRINGSNRYDTSAKIAEKYKEKTGADKVVIASGENFPDALVAGPYASKVKAPILLSGKKSVIESVRNQVSSIGTKGVIAVGGISSLNPENIKITNRISGKNRYETALNVAQKMSSDKAYIASGEVFADSLVAAPLASLSGSPILLRGKYNVQSNVADYVNKNIKSLITVGGVSTVAEGIKNVEVKKPVTKVENTNNQDEKITQDKKSQKLAEIQKEFNTIENNYRQSKGVKPLQWFEGVKDGANTRAREIIQLFSHSRPDGRDAKTAFNIGGAHGFGENIIMSFTNLETESPKAIAERLFTLWKNSPPHNENMLEDSFTHHYLGIVEDSGRVFASDNFFMGEPAGSAVASESTTSSTPADSNVEETTNSNNNAQSEQKEEKLDTEAKFNAKIPAIKKKSLDMVNEIRVALGSKPVTLYKGFDAVLDKNTKSILKGAQIDKIQKSEESLRTPEKYRIMGGRMGGTDLFTEYVTEDILASRMIIGDPLVHNPNTKEIAVSIAQENGKVVYQVLYLGK